MRRPRLELELLVLLEQQNYVPLATVGASHFDVSWTGSTGVFGGGVIEATRLERPKTTLRVHLEVPTRASVAREALVQFGAKRYLEVDVRTTVRIRACYLLFLDVAVHCSQIVFHSFRGPQIKAAKCAYTLIPLLGNFTTITHEWSHF